MQVKIKYVSNNLEENSCGKENAREPELHLNLAILVLFRSAQGVITVTYLPRLVSENRVH
jgi:hypothetical protein